MPKFSSWTYLIIAGIFEIGFTTSMQLANNNWKSPWQITFILFAILSFTCLEQAIISIPLGTAYAVWTGIGAVGTVIIGMIFFKEPFNFLRLLLIANLIFSVVGLKLISYQSS